MSDHFSGPRALAGPAGDITDLYAFPSPQRPGHLVLVMNVLPNAGSTAFFSDAIVCRFRLRPITSIGPSTFTFGPEEQEIVFGCAFEAPQPNGMQLGRCTSSTGEAITFTVNNEQDNQNNSLRVFAGLRSDPFFFDLPAFLETMKTGQLAFKDVGRNPLDGANVLSVVVEVDCAPLLRTGDRPLFAVVGETVVAGKLPIRLERVGRPEVKNVILSWKQFDQVNHDLELRDLYNLEDVFHMSKDYRGAYRARLNANLTALDRLDGKTDWSLDAQGTHPLTDLLLADYLVVDVSKPYAEDSFFEIEWAMLQGRPHATCGGRSLNDDMMDTLDTLLINGGNGPRISDGVDQATQPASQVFPYLAPPNPPELSPQKGSKR